MPSPDRTALVFDERHLGAQHRLAVTPGRSVCLDQENLIKES
jgi:hypothetical protein